MGGRIHPVAGRVVLITGAARGIGAESARRLAGRGARVALLDLDGERLERVAAACPAASWMVADVADDDNLRAAVEETVQLHGGIDVVIANAGVGAHGTLASMDPRMFEKTIEINLLGVWRTLRAALPHVAARRGYLLAVSSVAALVHAPGMSAYCASKAGLEAMCDSLRAELAPAGVGVGVAYFSWVDTEMIPIGARTPDGAGMARLSPPFRRIHPVAEAGRAVVRGVERRSRRVTHPRWVGAMLLARGLLQPLVERRGFRRPPRRERPGR